MGPANDTGRRPRAWLHALIAAGLAAVAAVVYAPAVGYEFVSWDDPFYVYDNPKVLRGLTWEGLDWAFTEIFVPVTGNWHPLTWLSLQIDAAVWGADPAGYHLTNVLLHAANTALVYLALRRLTGAAGRSAAVALVWAVHPLHVESVAWVSERKDVLSTLFGLLGIWTYAAYAASPSDRRLALIFALLGLGLMAKPMLVTFPFVLLLLDYWPLGRVRTPWNWLPLVREKLPLFLLVAASCLVTMYTQRQAGAVGDKPGEGPSTRVAGVAVAYTTYLRQTIYPSGLAALHPRPDGPSPGWAPAAIAAAAGLTAVTVGAWALRRRAPYLLVGWLWFIGTLVPAIGLVQIGSHEYAERYTYFPHIGLFAALVWAGADLLGRVPWGTAARAAVVFGVAGVLAAAARQQLPYWQDSPALWGRVAAIYPNHTAPWLALADYYRRQGRVEEALRCLDECDRIRPDFYPARVFRLIILGKLD